MISIAKPIIGSEEKQAVIEVLESGILAQGARVKAFEDAFAQMCGVKHAIATSSETAALHAALLAQDIGPGDEVITTPYTFIASANSILYTGAVPVFVNSDPRTFNIDPHLIESAITPRTRAIMPVHLYGLSCEMNLILDICQRYNLILIEDACQSHAATYHNQRVGSFSTGAFSLYPTKNMTSGEGCMITTNDDAVAERCRAIRQHGMRRRYFHAELGFNYRMTDIHAAIGLEQLKKLERFNQIRQENAAYFSEHLRGVIVPCIPEGSQHVFHQYTVRVPDGHRDALVEHLTQHGVGYAIYYPLPVHKQQYYVERLGYSQTLTQSEQAAREVLSLPVHPTLSRANLETIVQTINTYFITNPR